MKLLPLNIEIFLPVPSQTGKTQWPHNATQSTWYHPGAARPYRTAAARLGSPCDCKQGVGASARGIQSDQQVTAVSRQEDRRRDSTRFVQWKLVPSVVLRASQGSAGQHLN